MSSNYVEEFPSDKLWLSLSDIRLIILMVGLLEFFVFHLLKDSKRICTSFWGFQPSIRDDDDGQDSVAVVKMEHRDVKEAKRCDLSVMRRGDVEVVLRSLGMFADGGGQPEISDADELFDLFEAESPTLEEVKEAFEVFDEDGDGFIDAQELQKVLCGLGMNEGMRVENCRRMIGVFDEDGDGRLDFDEFVRVMESTMC